MSPNNFGFSAHNNDDDDSDDDNRRNNDNQDNHNPFGFLALADPDSAEALDPVLAAPLVTKTAPAREGVQFQWRRHWWIRRYSQPIWADAFRYGFQHELP